MRIGILEDYSALGRVLQLSLELSGYTVNVSQTILDFLTFVTSSAPVDLIIVDFLLLTEHTEIKISGADVIRHVRAMYPNLPVILISAAPLTTLEASIRGLSNVKILLKPFRTAVLLEMVRKIAYAHNGSESAQE